MPEPAAGPLHSVLDVVRVSDHPILAKRSLSGRRGVVLSIRRYPGGHHRYVIGSLGADDDDDVPGIYDEECLQPTAERSHAERFGPPAPFRLRDVVCVSDQCDDEELRGQTGVIEGAYPPDSRETAVGVWIEALEESVIIDVRDLTRTGERLSPPPLDRASTSTRVSTDGVLLGSSSYVILDDIDKYL